MCHSRVLLLVGLWLTATLPVAGQSSSHELLPGVIDRKAAEKRLAERFQISAEKNPLGLLEMLLKNPERYGIDPKKVAEMAKEMHKRPQDFNIDPNDPKIQELARRFAEQAKFTPEQIETLKRLQETIPNFKPLDIKPPDVKPPDVKPPDIKPPDIKPADGMKPPDVKPADGGMPPVVPPPPVVQPAPERDAVVKPGTEKKKGWLASQISDLRSKTGLSGELRERLRDFLGADSVLGELSRETRRFSSKLLPDLSGIRLDRMMRDILPSGVHISPPKLDVSFGAPSVSAPGVPDGDSIASFLMVIVMIAAAGIAVYALAKSRGWVGERGDNWKLGPWPVAPDAVRTRDDVVKAFEYLALLLLGRKAGAANHLDIAGQLAARDNSGRKAEAAGELAELYEHARYAPAAEMLSEAEMEQARRDLCYLAGVSAA